MEVARECRREGVLNHLSQLEMEVMVRSKQQLLMPKPSQVDDLRIMVETLRARRDQLKAIVEGTMGVDDQRTEECDKGNRISEDGCTGIAQSQLSSLMARRAEAKNLLRAHHLIGGYDATETQKGVCFSIPTAFEGLYLEVYNLELTVSRVVQICRHNIPPFIPLERLAQQHLQTDLTSFLSCLNGHLNAFIGRRQQIRLIQKMLPDSVELMESSLLFHHIVLMCRDSGEKGSAVLCTLEYADLSRYLPTVVTIESEDKSLPSTALWKECRSELLCAPLHSVFQSMKMKGQIA
ncbi:hypothetical protein GJAV_G00022260 [Gymnothorax javanicus]|nr:hypothetical protein GJAV_G00022260 [Gymnothorax javanicus]